MSKQVLDNSLNADFTFQIGKYLAQGWNILRSRISAFLFLSLVIGGLQVYLLSSYDVMDSWKNYSFSYKNEEDMDVLKPVELSWYWQILLPILIFPLCYAAFYVVANRLRTKDVHSVEDYILAFEHFASLALNRLVQFFIIYLLLIPALLAYKPLASVLQFYLGLAEVPSIAIGIISILFFLSFVYFYTAYIFSDQYIIFKGKNYWNAMTSSRQKTNPHFFLVLILLIIFMLIGLFFVSTLSYFYVKLMLNAYDYEKTGNVLFLEEPIKFLKQFPSLPYIIVMIIALTYPYTYCVLHAAFADLEQLPIERTIDPEEMEEIDF